MTALRWLLVTALLAMPATAGTILTFNSLGFDRLVAAGDEEFEGGFDNTFGSNAVGNSSGILNGDTPGVSVLWGSSDPTSGNAASNHWYTNADTAAFTPNDYFVINGSSSIGSLSEPITLTGAGVLAQSVDLIFGAGRATVTVSRDGGLAVLVYDSGIIAGGTFVVDLTNGGAILPSLTSSQIVIQYFNSGNEPLSNLGTIDNLTFAAVPEPGTLGMIGAGALLICWRRFVKRSA